MASQTSIATTDSKRTPILDQILRPFPPVIGLATWVHWHAVGALIPPDGSPLPYADFIVTFLFMTFLCAWSSLVALAAYSTWKGKLLGGALPASFVAYTLSHFIR